DLGLVRTPGMVEERPVQGEEARRRASAAARSALSSKDTHTGASLASLGGVTELGQSMGTPAYMAPEQARDSTRVDHRADIYALGSPLSALVPGQAPCGGGSALEIITRHATQPVPRPETLVKDVPRDLSEIILKMMAKKPDERYPDCAAVIKALEAFLGL